MIELIPTPVTDPVALSLLEEYVAFRVASFPGPQRYLPAAPDPVAFTGPGLFLVAFVDGAPNGCGGVRGLTPDRFEIKHLFVRSTARGRGVGGALIDGLESHARANGAVELVLDTHSSLSDAAALYRSRGFEPTPPYNENPNADTWYRKVMI